MLPNPVLILTDKSTDRQVTIPLSEVMLKERAEGQGTKIMFIHRSSLDCTVKEGFGLIMSFARGEEI